jgi:hypothetical protein
MPLVAVSVVCGLALTAELVAGQTINHVTLLACFSRGPLRTPVATPLCRSSPASRGRLRKTLIAGRRFRGLSCGWLRMSVDRVAGVDP